MCKSIGLFPYQLEAIDKLKNGNILCGGVGSGKSRTAIGYYYKENGGSLEPYGVMSNPQDLYIITTARKRDDKEWLKDLLPFNLTDDQSISMYDSKVIIDSWNNIHKYKDVTNAFFIFDEQRLVGYGTWVKSFLKIAKNNKWLLLTATPGDCWKDYIAVFIANGFYKNKTEFMDRHVVWTHYSRYPKISRYLEQGHLIKLRSQIVVKMNYQHSTIHHDENVFVDYDKEKYKLESTKRWNTSKNEPYKNVSELCIGLRKIVNLDSSRLSSIQFLTSEHPKAIIFYNFDYELEVLLNLKYIKGTEVAQWNGHKHEEIPNSERWVYLVQYAAGSEGWNCISTDTIIFYSLNYSYKTMVQAAGRIDRLTTPYTDLYYYHIMSRAPIDLGINAALKKKKDFNASQFFYNF